MKNDKKTGMFVVIVSLVMVVVAVGSISFAYFSTRIEEGDIYTTTGRAKNDNFRISMTENQSGVTTNNTYPMPDEKGLKTDPYTFTVKNEETSKNLTITVILEVLNNSTLADELVNVAIGNDVKTLDSTISTTPSSDTYRSAFNILTFDLDAEESKTYSLRNWINANGTVENAQNKTWSGRILVVPSLRS